MLFDIWSKVIDTQMHFNEMSNKSRQLGLTFVVSALALATVMMAKADDWSLRFGKTPVWLVSLASGVFVAVSLALGVRIVLHSIRTEQRSTWSVRLWGGYVAVCVIGAGLATYRLSSVTLDVPQTNLHGSVIIVLASAGALYVVQMLDLRVYHRMLRGSVTFNEDLEARYFVPEVLPKLALGMTSAVSHFSRYKDAKVTKDDIGQRLYAGNIKVSAEDKIRTFYDSTIVILVITAAFLAAITNMNALSAVHALGKAPTTATRSASDAGAATPPLSASSFVDAALTSTPRVDAGL